MYTMIYKKNGCPLWKQGSKEELKEFAITEQLMNPDSEVRIFPPAANDLSVYLCELEEEYPEDYIWSMEVWKRTDLEDALLAYDINASDENVAKLREECEGIFDDKSGRNEMISDIVTVMRRRGEFVDAAKCELTSRSVQGATDMTAFYFECPKEFSPDYYPEYYGREAEEACMELIKPTAGEGEISVSIALIADGNKVITGWKLMYSGSGNHPAWVTQLLEKAKAVEETDDLDVVNDKK